MLFAGTIKPWKCLALTCPATYLKAKKARYHLKHSQILLKCTPVILPTLISLWYSIAYLWLWLTDCFASTGSSHVPLVRVLGQIALASRRQAEGAYCSPVAHIGKSTHSQASYEYHRYLWAPFLWVFSHGLIWAWALIGAGTAGMMINSSQREP